MIRIRFKLNFNLSSIRSKLRIEISNKAKLKKIMFWSYLLRLTPDRTWLSSRLSVLPEAAIVGLVIDGDDGGGDVEIIVGTSRETFWRAPVDRDFSRLLLNCRKKATARDLLNNAIGQFSQGQWSIAQW